MTVPADPLTRTRSAGTPGRCGSRQDTGHPDADAALRAIGFRLLELGFTIAEQGGLDVRAVEHAVARVYALPGYAARTSTTEATRAAPDPML
ncbi:hypothetical protein [Saccharomonospora halophila]|uniref:hypothetical protein n=1 Tax=Saccharomonospora halophila TaxID=129922 RepID=UPI000369CDCC|nr:hypothetical protein [Saccharomonospora halophila]